MANLPESATYDAGVYQIETTDAVIGGAAGKANAGAINLANRTAWLKIQVDNLLAAILVVATETVSGVIKIATQAQADAGTDDTAAVTSKKIRWGFSVLFAANGFIMLPSWMGGWTFQWIHSISDVSGNMIVPWVTNFPTEVLAGWACEHNPSGWSATSTSVWAFDISLSSVSSSYSRVRTISGTAGPVINSGIAGYSFAIGR